MGDADEYEMAGVGFHCCRNRNAQCRKIDGAKLFSLGWARMRHAHKMHKCAFLRNVRVVSATYRAAKDRVASHGKPGYGRNASERAEFVAALKQHARQPATHIARAASEED